MNYLSPLQKRLFLIFSISVAAALICSAILGAYVYRVVSATPEFEPYEARPEEQVLFDTHGEEIGRLAEEEQVYVSVDQIPVDVQQALLATEDRRFLSHGGIDLVGIVRATARNVAAGEIVEGASTITQQLARTLYLSAERTLERKIAESYLALQLERRYSKSQILEMYLNEAYFGSGASGIEAAAQRYFGIPAEELSLAQGATLIGTLSAPVHRNPFSNPEGDAARRNSVLSNMVEAGYLPETQAHRAQQGDLELADPAEREDRGQAFISLVREQLIEEFGADTLYGRELEIHTTLDLEMQESAREAIDESLDDGVLPTVEDDEEPIDEEQPQPALVSIDSNSGAVRAMVGGRGNDTYNRAVVSERQPGSAFKPFVYSAVFAEQDYHPGTVVNDMPMYEVAGNSSTPERAALSNNNENPARFEVWPRNFDNRYRGLVSLRDALAYSLNVPAVRLARDVGIEDVRDHVESFGFTTLGEEDGVSDHFSFPLGGLQHGVTPLEMASAYGVFANNGVYSEPFMIERIEDEEGDSIFEVDVDPVPVVSAGEAYVMRDMLVSSVEYGTGSRAALPESPVAGKTGTTDRNTDGWFIGFADETVTSLWVGEDRAVPMIYDYDEQREQYERTSDEGDFEVLGVHGSEIWQRFWSSFQEVQDDRRKAEERAEVLFFGDARYESPRVNSVDFGIAFDPEVTGEQHLSDALERMEQLPPETGVGIDAVRRLTASEEVGPAIEAISEFSWEFRPADVHDISIDPVTGVRAELLPHDAEVETVTEIATRESGFGLLARIPTSATAPTLGPLFNPGEELLDADFLVGYRSGPETVQLGGHDQVRSADGARFEGVYHVDEGEPVQYIDRRLGLPSHPDKVRFEPVIRALVPEPLPAQVFGL